MADTHIKEKHILIFSARWCAPCKQMAAHVWSNESVKSQISKYTSVQRLDIEDSTGSQLAMIYGISGVPTVIVVDKDGKQLKRGNFMNVPQITEFLSQYVSKKFSSSCCVYDRLVSVLHTNEGAYMDSPAGYQSGQILSWWPTSVYNM